MLQEDISLEFESPLFPVQNNHDTNEAHNIQSKNKKRIEINFKKAFQIMNKAIKY